MITKPMKAATYIDGVTQIQFPVEVTDKFDGIRCLKVGGRALTSAFKPIPNDFIRTWIEANCPDGFDGEIMVPGRTFNELSGDVRRKDGEPDFRYHVFDWVTGSLTMAYINRVALLEGLDERKIKRNVAGTGLWARFIPELPVTVHTMEELLAYETEALARGREGVMIRDPMSPYKCGRSTIAEGYLIKIKRFEDDEAEVIGWEEEMENCNVAERDAFGRTKRSKHKENLRPKGTLGKLLCRTKAGIEFEIGTGFKAKDRQELFARRNEFFDGCGLWVKYKHQPHGAKEKPRIPVWLGFRETWDMTD